MAIPASGPLSMTDIQTEFGGTNPIGLNEYYAGGGLVPAGMTGTYGAVPSSGEISIRNFYGTSNVSGWYYVLTAQQQYYTPQVGGVQPLSTGGWMLSVAAFSGTTAQSYILVTDTTGTITTSKYKSSPATFAYFGNKGNASTFPGDTVPHLTQGTGGVMTPIDSSVAISGTPAVHNPPYYSSLAPVAGSPSNYQYFASSSYTYNPEQGFAYMNVGGTNFQTNTRWAKQYTYAGGTWGYIRSGVCKANDPDYLYVAVQITAPGNSTGILKYDRVQGDIVAGYYVNGFSGGETSVISDPSGNMYLSNTSGRLIRISADLTSVQWYKSYSVGAQNFGYLHAAYYDGYIYMAGSQHPNGNYIAKINPANGDVIWGITINNSFLYGIDGISVGPNGVVVSGLNDDFSSGFRKSAILNYPLSGGLYGNFNSGTLVIAAATVNASSLTASMSTLSTPAFVALGTAAGSTFGLTTSAFPYSKVSI